MLHYVILVIQNSLPTALLVALLFAAAGARNMKRLAAGAAAGTLAALVLSVLRRSTRLVNREQVSLAVLLAAIAVSLLCILTLRSGSGGRKTGRLRDALESWSGPALCALLLFYALPTILLYPTEFLLPEQSPLSTDFLFKSFGFVAGAAVAALSASALYHTGKAAGGRAAGILLRAALAVNMAGQASVILQFMLARRIFRAPRWVFALVVKSVNYNAVFLYCLAALTVILPAIIFMRSFRPAAAYRNPAELRKIRAGKRGQRRWCAVLAAGYVFSLATVTAVKAYAERGVVLAPAEAMTIVGQEIVIPLEKVSDGHLHRYNYTAEESIEMRFIIIKKNETAYGVGLDACDICGPTGYYERKDGVICRLCDVVMNKSTIGLKGGCNPVPLAYALRKGSLVIDTANLEKERARFR
ncbi:MAG: DUF2318 domain-containing protein [Spirochaetaceae bacterium]|jgi:uncharacterized membrane protein|nr:DUF2318 domain-containing protein [Spirochaetaceae bacterium]